MVTATTRQADAARGASLGESHAGGRRDADGRGVLGVCEGVTGSWCGASLGERC